VRQVDPIIQPVNGIIDRVLRVAEGETSEHHLADIRLAVAISIFEIEDVRGVGNQDPSSIALRRLAW